MDASEVKSALKQAKANLAKGDSGQEALNLLRKVLKQDANNYQALVLEGAALQQIGKATQSLASYKKAISVNPKLVLAWQGVVAHYDKRGVKEHEDLIEAYKNISKFYEKDDDKSKYLDATLKFVGQLQSQNLFPQAIRVLMRVVKSNGTNVKISQAAVGILSQMSNLEADEESFYITCLRNLHETATGTDDQYRKYFQLLYKDSKFTELEDVCRDLSPRFNTFYYPLDYLCRLYVEKTLSNDGVDLVPSWVQKLFKLYPSSSFGSFAQGKIFFEAGLYVDAITWLKQGTESKFHEEAVYLLMISFQKIWDFEQVEEYGLRILKVPNLKDKNRFLITLGNAYIQQNKFNAASMLLEKAQPSEEVTVLGALINYEEENFEKFQKVCAQVQDWRLEFCALKVDKENTVERYVQLAEKYPDNFDLLLLVGIELRKMGAFHEALHVFQQCLCLFKSHPILLVELAEMFKEEEEYPTALNYLKSAYKTLPSPQIGMRLSDLYFQLGENDENKALLKHATKTLKKTKSKWAWLRLGMLYLELKDPSEAVSSLQSAIRTDIGDCHVWETLAEAYYARGSYEASLKAFEQCLKLGAVPTYPNFKIGVIQRQLGEEEDAIATLSNLPDYSPAVVELARTYLQIAQKKYDEGLSIAVIVALNQTFKMAARVMNTPEQLLGLTLMSDAILLGGQLNPNSVFSVPSSLVTQQGNEDEVQVSAEQLLRLGLRIAAIVIKNSDSKHLISFQHFVMGKIYLLLYQKLALETVQKALYHAKKAVSINRSNYSYWNSLGIVAEAAGDKSLALHAYLNSIEKNPTGSAATWTNLGLLLYSTERYLEAHRCFTQAQRFEPAYGAAWIGQGLVAEKLMKEDHWTDLYRHAAGLEETEIQGSLCYAYHVAKIMLSAAAGTKFDHHYNYTINHLDALNVSLERIGLFNLRRSSAESLNIQGILESQVGLFGAALETFQRAARASRKEEQVGILERNKMAVLKELGKYQEVLEMIESQPKADDFKIRATEALALEKTGNFERAYTVLEELLPRCSNGEQKANILFSMALLSNRLSGLDTAKTLFFKACECDPTPRSYTALCSLALLASDLRLAQVVVQRMEKNFQKQKYIHTIALFKSFSIVAAGGDPMSALRGILSFVRKYPRSGKLWTVLGNHFINFQSEGRMGRRALTAASILGEKATQPAIALTYLLEGDFERALKEAQKGILQSPNQLGPIAILVATLAAKEASVGSSSTYALKLAQKGVEMVSKDTEMQMDDRTEALHQWLSQYLEIACAT